MAQPQQAEFQPVERRQRRAAMLGMLLALTLAALDQNIVGTALPRIVSDLGGLSHLSWVITAFLLASTATTPLYGKLSDMYGRRPLFSAAIVIFLAGSMLCGLAQSMTQLILFRGIQGLGAGGLMVMAQTTIADLIPPRERGRHQGRFGGIFALCSVAGPLLGGLITDALSWRWIFYVNLPVGALALFMIGVGLQRPNRVVAHSVDYLGAALLTAATSSTVLMLSWGGALYPWGSPQVLGLGAVSLTLFALLPLAERRAKEPILPLELFSNRIFVISSAVTGLTAMALFGAVVFLPLFFQLVLRYSPSRAGLMILPLMIGLIISSVVGGRLVSATGKYKRFPVIGLAASALSFAMMAAVASNQGSVVLLEFGVFVLGAGLGLVMPNLTVAIQNSVDPKSMGVATSASSYFRSLGGSVGVACSGGLVAYRLHTMLPAEWTHAMSGGKSLIEQGVQQIIRLPEAQRELIISAYRSSIASSLVVGAMIAGLAFLVAMALPEKPLHNRTQFRRFGGPPEEESAPAGSPAVEFE